jgi:branched-chain amino acid aminotransferase
VSVSKAIWMDGDLVPYDDARIHVATSALHFGPTAFEGIRSYGSDRHWAHFFRLREHLERLGASARALHLEVPFSTADLEEACDATLVANGFAEAYIRPLVFAGSGALGFGRPGGPSQTCVLAFPWDNAHVERSQRRGISVHVASVVRTQGHPMLSKSKISANYAAGILAVHDARAAGCDDAILLDPQGWVAEAPTANVFAVWGERVVTPPLELPILAGITRDTLLVLARDLGIDVAEETFDCERLRSANEIFLCGTTSEVTPVRALDGRPVADGAPGPVTAALAGALRDALSGRGPDRNWIRPVGG